MGCGLGVRLLFINVVTHVRTCKSHGDGLLARQVRWPGGNEESYRAGADNMCDVRPKDLDLPDPDLAPALQAIVDMLDVNLEVRVCPHSCAGCSDSHLYSYAQTAIL
jgi:hypothetical protein